MFDRFTDRARKVMGLARQEAQRFNHDYIGTEHVLLGLVQEGSGVAASVLKNLDIDLKKIRHEVEKLVSNGTTMVTMGQLPFTPRAKKVLELSLEEDLKTRFRAYVANDEFIIANEDVRGLQDPFVNALTAYPGPPTLTALSPVAPLPT